MARSKTKTGDRVVCTNRRARHDYQLIDTLEAGLVLRGSEVKALREGRGNLVDAYVRIRDGKATLVGFDIMPYSHDTSSEAAGSSKRPRELLMHRHEIRRWESKAREKRLTFVATKVYFQGPWAKVEVAMARGKKAQDKRQALKEREARRDIDRETRGRRRR